MSLEQPQEAKRPATDEDPSVRFDLLPNDEQRQLLAQRLESLPERLRLLLALRYLEGLGVAELASALSMSPDEVGLGLTEAMQALMRSPEAAGPAKEGNPE